MRRNEAQRLKDLGNVQYNESQYEKAIEYYTDALAVCLLCHANDRAILYANRAAAKVKLVSKHIISVISISISLCVCIGMM